MHFTCLCFVKHIPYLLHSYACPWALIDLDHRITWVGRNLWQSSYWRSVPLGAGPAGIRLLRALRSWALNNYKNSDSTTFWSPCFESCVLSKDIVIQCQIQWQRYDKSDASLNFFVIINEKMVCFERIMFSRNAHSSYVQYNTIK